MRLSSRPGQTRWRSLRSRVRYRPERSRNRLSCPLRRATAQRRPPEADHQHGRHAEDHPTAHGRASKRRLYPYMPHSSQTSPVFTELEDIPPDRHSWGAWVNEVVNDKRRQDGQVQLECHETVGKHGSVLSTLTSADVTIALLRSSSGPLNGGGQPPEVGDPGLDELKTEYSILGNSRVWSKNQRAVFHRYLLTSADPGVGRA